MKSDPIDRLEGPNARAVSSAAACFQIPALTSTPSLKGASQDMHVKR